MWSNRDHVAEVEIQRSLGSCKIFDSERPFWPFDIIGVAIFLVVLLGSSSLQFSPSLVDDSRPGDKCPSSGSAKRLRGWQRADKITRRC